MNVKGTAILAPGQYRGAYKIGYHKGYKALIQKKSVRVYRDNNRDLVYDMNPKTTDEGVFGVNIHKAGYNSTYIDSWSAGCQVFKVNSEFVSFMNLVKKQVDNKMGETFTYTLINEEDLK